MPKNRDYTGLVRTPSSMAWLIAQRGRLRGQLDRYKRQQQALPEKIQRLEVELACLDAVIPLHEVQVDPQAIVGVQPHRMPAAAYGALTHCLLTNLREAQGQPVTTIELTLRFARQNKIDSTRFGHADLMDRVSRRLRTLVAQGVVRRCHSKDTTEHGSWTLVPFEEEGSSP